jgi:hypothetical protein
MVASLLPLSAAKPPFSASRSAERWAALPVAVGPWTYAAKHAKLATFCVVALSAVAAVLFAAGLGTGLESGDWTAAWVVFAVAGLAALFAPSGVGLPAPLSADRQGGQRRHQHDQLAEGSYRQSAQHAGPLMDHSTTRLIRPRGIETGGR